MRLSRVFVDAPLASRRARGAARQRRQPRDARAAPARRRPADALQRRGRASSPARIEASRGGEVTVLVGRRARDPSASRRSRSPSPRGSRAASAWTWWCRRRPSSASRASCPCSPSAAWCASMTSQSRAQAQPLARDRDRGLRAKRAQPPAAGARRRCRSRSSSRSDAGESTRAAALPELAPAHPGRAQAGARGHRAHRARGRTDRGGAGARGGGRVHRRAPGAARAAHRDRRASPRSRCCSASSGTSRTSSASPACSCATCPAHRQRSTTRSQSSIRRHPQWKLESSSVRMRARRSVRESICASFCCASARQRAAGVRLLRPAAEEGAGLRDREARIARQLDDLQARRGLRAVAALAGLSRRLGQQPRAFVVTDARGRKARGPRQGADGNACHGSAP